VAALQLLERLLAGAAAVSSRHARRCYDMRIVLLLTAALPLACAGAPAPPPASGDPASGGAGCTEMGCQSGFQVELQPGSRWPAGHYRFDIEADGVAQQCEVTLPLQACEAGPSVRCSGASCARGM